MPRWTIAVFVSLSSWTRVIGTPTASVIYSTIMCWLKGKRRRGSVEQLTQLEREVLVLVAEAKRNTAIIDRLSEPGHYPTAGVTSLAKQSETHPIGSWSHSWCEILATTVTTVTNVNGAEGDERRLLAFAQIRWGAGEGTRTPNRPITSRVRCQLRHAGRHVRS